MGTYEESEEGKQEAIYQLALIKMGNKNYEEALALFNKVRDYKDSAAYIDMLNWARLSGPMLVSADNEKIPSQIVIPDYIEVLGKRAFADCNNLKSVEIPDSVTEIGDRVFYSCDSLTSVEIPDSVTEIGEGAFYGCSGLTSVEIPDSVTEIGDRAFMDCSSLTSVEISDGVTEIGSYAFYGCSSLTSVEVPDGVTIDATAFQGTPLEGVY